jgi:hypothetical protein
MPKRAKGLDSLAGPGGSDAAHAKARGLHGALHLGLKRDGTGARTASLHVAGEHAAGRVLA